MESHKSRWYFQKKFRPQFRKYVFRISAHPHLISSPKPAFRTYTVSASQIPAYTNKCAAFINPAARFPQIRKCAVRPPPSADTNPQFRAPQIRIEARFPQIRKCAVRPPPSADTKTRTSCPRSADTKINPQISGY